MARKKIPQEDPPQQLETADDGMIERNIPDENLPRRRGKNIRLKTDADGNILWDEMSEAQKQQFASSVSNDANALEMIGLASSENAEGETVVINVLPEITEENVKMGLDFLQWIQSIVFTKVMKFDEDIAKKVCKFDEHQHKELDPRGCRIANKYSPELFKKFQDEAVFVGMMAWYMSMQMQQAKEMQKDRNKDKRAEVMQKAEAISIQKAASA